ncbi:MAG: HupE/UreJ family protein [Pseudomonadales bacterium]
MRRLLLVMLVSVVLSPFAYAHKMAPSLLALQETASGQIAVNWKTPRVLSTPTRIEARLPAHCAETEAATQVPDPVGAVWRWQVDCGVKGLVGHGIRIDGLVENKSAALVRIDLLDGREFRVLLNGDQNEYLVPKRAQRGQVMWDYFLLGMDHILKGVDHLFFVWALILLLPLRKLLIAVTAFTLGHSVTLALAALQIVRVPQDLTEIFIALTILLLANELASKRANKDGLVKRHSFIVCSAFGLLHGLGFASALIDIGLPQEEIVAALLMFNVGVEVGQITFIGVVLVLGWLLARAVKDWLPKLRWLPTYVIGSAAAFWCIERSMGLLL